MNAPTQIEPDAEWSLPAEPSAVRALRAHAGSFAAAAGAPDGVVEAITLAVSELVTNTVLHAYANGAEGHVQLTIAIAGERFTVSVVDAGVGIAPRRDSPGLGHGLAMVGALAQTLSIGPGPGDRGTVVTMTFGPAPAPSVPPGLEALCELALDTLADVSCVDLNHEGVLRRLAARVAGDDALTAWLRAAIPPAKPGTATWAALREGGPRLVIHDPTVARTIGGTGERLSLVWWVAVPLDAADGGRSALWGFGGRADGRPVPNAAVLDTLTEAASADLAEPAERALLRGRLAAAVG